MAFKYLLLHHLSRYCCTIPSSRCASSKENATVWPTKDTDHGPPPPPPNTRYYQYFIIYVACVLYMYFAINFFCMYSTFLNCMYQQSWKDQCTNILYDFRCGRLCIFYLLPKQNVTKQFILRYRVNLLLGIFNSRLDRNLK